MYYFHNLLRCILIPLYRRFQPGTKDNIDDATVAMKDAEVCICFYIVYHNLSLKQEVMYIVSTNKLILILDY